MKFINRKDELDTIKESAELSKKKIFSLSILGLRRVGKTRLILEMLNNRDLYFFVNRGKESQSLLKEYEAILKEKKILTELESLKNWDEFFSIVFKRFKGTIVFDEFQNFTSVDNSVFGILQKNIDLNESNKGILFIFSGSTIGLMKKLFSDAKEPLYGRLKRKLNLQPLSLKVCTDICALLKIKDIKEAIELYTIFGGYPRYYVCIEDENLFGKSTTEILESFFFQKDAILEEEISQILSLEFGKRSGIYYDILTAIANGNTKISEIASFLRKKETDLTRQLNELTNHFEIIGIESPVIKGRNTIYIKHPLIKFWFRFFYKSLSTYKRREDWLISKTKKELNNFIGKRFEDVCLEFISEHCPFNFTKVGRQWGKFKGEKGKNTYEIDILALNEKTKEILFGECKWQEKVKAKEILQDLKQKASYVNWHNKKRKESYAVFAKSFSQRLNEFEGGKVHCFDLKDLEKTLKK